MEINQWRVDRWSVASLSISMHREAGIVTPNTIPDIAIPFMMYLTRQSIKNQSVDQIWTAFNEIIPRSSASSVFNLKPAGTPISHTQPERNKLLLMLRTRCKIQEYRASSWSNNDKPTILPKRISTATLDQRECLRNAALCAYSTFEWDLKMTCYHKT